MLSGGRVKSMLPHLIRRAARAGNELTSLYPTHVSCWWPIVEGIFTSPAAAEVSARIATEYIRSQEALYISIDATLKCTLPLVGQSHPLTPVNLRVYDAFKGEGAIKRVLTIRGRTGAVIGMVPMAKEDHQHVADALESAMCTDLRDCVRFVAVDNPSRALYVALARVFPQLEVMCLDPVHLPLTYEYAFWRRRTPGSSCLRRLMTRFMQMSPSYAGYDWGGALRRTG